jgi:hypothetical protein
MNCHESLSFALNLVELMAQTWPNIFDIFSDSRKGACLCRHLPAPRQAGGRQAKDGKLLQIPLFPPFKKGDERGISFDKFPPLTKGGPGGISFDKFPPLTKGGPGGISFDKGE